MSVLLVAALSCSKGVAGDRTGEEEIECGFTICGAKSGDTSPVTYRAMLHKATAGASQYPYLNISGTYRGPGTDDGRSWLTACEVNPTTGQFVKDDDKSGLRADRGSYFLSFVSPAVLPKEYVSESNGEKEWGIPLKRDPVSGEELSISSPVLLTLSGNHLDGMYVYDVPDSVALKQRRSMVSLKLKCGDDLESVTVNKVGWSHYYESCMYNMRLDSLDTFTLSDPTDTTFVYDPSSPLVLNKGADAVVAGSAFPLLSVYYGQKDEHGVNAFETPEIDVYVSRGVAKLKVFQNMMPQYTYTYTITINSAYVNVSVTAVPWDDKGSSETSVDDPLQKTPSFTCSWDSISDSGTID